MRKLDCMFTHSLNEKILLALTVCQELSQALGIRVERGREDPYMHGLIFQQGSHTTREGRILRGHQPDFPILQTRKQMQ